MTQDDIVRYTGWVTDLITAVCALKFLYSFRNLKERTPGLYMVLILSISDLAYPITNMFRLTFQNGLNGDFFYPLAVYIYRFSLYWSTIIAVFTYFVIAKKKTFDPDRFIIRGAILCLCASLLCPLMIITHLWGISVRPLGPGLSVVYFPPPNLAHQLIGWLIYDVIGTLGALGVILYCYSKVYKALKLTYGYMDFGNGINPKRVFIYVAIPFISFMPWAIADLTIIFANVEYPFWLMITVTTARRCWGFLNLLAYWFLSPYQTKSLTPSLECSLNEDSVRI